MNGLARIAGAHRPARAAQLADALRAGGFETTNDPAAPAAAVAWPGDAARNLPLDGLAINLVDLDNAAAASGHVGPARLAAWCEAVAESCRGADLVLTGSDDERGFWVMELNRAGIAAPVVVAPLAIAAEPRHTRLPDALVVVLEHLPDDLVLSELADAVRWAAGRPGMTMRVFAVPGPGGAPGLLAMRRLRDILPGAVAEWQPGAALPPGVLLDVRPDTPGARIAAPAAVLGALAQGMPVVSAADGAMSREIVAAGAGTASAPRALASALDRWAALPKAAQAAMSDAAAALFRQAFAPDRVNAALGVAIAEAAASRGARVAAWDAVRRPAPQPLGPGSHVLVLSDEEENLRDVRVHLPFGALHRRGAIGGYSVLHRGEFVFSTRAGALDRMGDDARFDAVWVHRGHSAAMRLMLEIIDRPFVFDIDDNLLSTPSYRPPFSAKALGVVRGLIGLATVLTCSTAHLAGLLQHAAGVPLAAKGVVAPNLAHAPPAPRAAGLPRALIWASSDTPALTGTRSDVIRAVRDFCLAHRLRVVCMGANPPEVLTGAGLEIEHVGILPYAAYLDYLRALSPSILVCPLETDADPATQAFVDGKSDIKVLDALLAGVVGVFSDARPYRESGLRPPILCANTYDGWLDGLDRAHRACGAAAPAAPWPGDRDPRGAGLMPWAEALGRVWLRMPLRLHEIRAAMDYIEKLQARFLEAQEFDAAYYLAVHDDVRKAVESGAVASAYDHYLSSGHKERRDARSLAEGQAGTAAWWSVLVHTIDTLEAAVAAHGETIERLQGDRAARQALADRR